MAVPKEPLDTAPLQIHTLGDDVLRLDARRIGKVDETVRDLARDMLRSMYTARGIGLAAPQVGVHQQLLVIDLDPETASSPPLVLINPEFVVREGELTWEEGCLSVPGETGKVTRAAKVTMKYTDLDGNEQTVEAEGLKAVALQHEVDHLDGKLFVDYISRMKRNLIRKKMQKLRAERDAA